MRVSVIGCGKLGTPVAIAFTEEHRVLGHDTNPDLMSLRPYEQREGGYNGLDFQQLFEDSVNDGYLRFAQLEECVQQSEIVFVAVQTPHKPELDGTRRLTSERADFDYSFLKDAVGKIARAAKLCTHKPILAIISTVLPGTIRREILPLVGKEMGGVVYCPFFAAMGTVVRDVLDPEFVLFGHGGPDSYSQVNAVGKVMEFFKILCPDAPQVTMSFESAELAKVAYNLYISRKLEYINSLTEIAHNIPNCEIGEVSNILSLAHRRLLSPAYLKPGGCEGGACHPRDAIAMSWLANDLDLSSDPFGAVMMSREAHVEWLVGLICSKSKEHQLPVLILGKAFKADSNITAGSYALLLANVLADWGVLFIHHDPLVDGSMSWGEAVNGPYVAFIATKHKVFAGYKFAPGSVVLDPHHMIKPQEGVEVIRIGEGK